MSNNGLFPYTVNQEYVKLNDGICCNTVSQDSWHWHRCTKKVKELIDGVGFCGIHARSIKIWKGNK